MGAYDDVLSALDLKFGEEKVNQFLPHARQSLKSLRTTYRSSGTPLYDNSFDRLAYVLAYHPPHMDMAVWSLNQSKAFINSLDSSVVLNVVILGAGPGAELLALANHLAKHFPNLKTLDATLVDRQSEWHYLRQIVTIPAAQRKLGECTLRINELKVDLLCEKDRTALKNPLSKADLVISHAVLSEVASCDGGDVAIDWLCSVLRDGTPMLLVDLQKSKGGGKALDRCANAGLQMLTSATETRRIGKPPHRLETAFFSREDNLYARQNTYAGMQLIVCGSMPVRFPASTITFTSDQQKVIESFELFLQSAESTPVAVLRGAAGTGKSTLLRELVRRAFKAERKPQLVAPTGQASKRLSDATDHAATTIHSALYMHCQTLIDDDGGRIVGFGRTDTIASNLLIVDEASLIGDTSMDDEEDAVRLLFNEGQLLTDLLEVLALYRPGLQILFVGDHHQLPPVAESSDRPALDAESLAKRLDAPVPVWQLETVVRQAEGSTILATATSCRFGKALAEHTNLEEVTASALFDNADSLQDGSAVLIAWMNNTVAGFNREIRSWWGRYTPNPEIGDRLVAIRSSMDLTFINGDEMIVESVGSATSVTRQLGKSGESVTAHLLALVVSIGGENGRILMDVLVLLDGIEGQKRDTLDKVERVLTIDACARYREQRKIQNTDNSEAEFLRNDPTFNALRVVYPYARTCHRAQGGEWNTVIVDLSHGNAAPSGWDYTAVTRARKRLVVVNRPKDFGSLNIAEELRTPLEQLGLRVDFRPLQYGAQQLTVQDESMSVLVNVYLKRNLPSKGRSTARG